MAEKKISNSELIQKDVFGDTKKSAEDALSTVEKLIFAFKELKKESDKVLNKKGSPRTAQELKDITTALDNSKKSREALTKAELAYNKILKENISLQNQQKSKKNLTDEETAAIQLETKARKDRVNEIKRTIVESELEEGSIAKLRLELSKLTKEYDNISAAKRNSAKGKELEKSIADQTAALNKLEQSTGRFQRNVGNYASGFNGLNNAVNQIGRELPNFAIRFETGIQAISNNIPILADEIQRVKAANDVLKSEGKPTVSLFKQITGAIFSWQTAITVGITALIAFAPKIKEFIFGTEKAAEATTKQADAQDLLNQRMSEFKRIQGFGEDKPKDTVLGILKQGLDASVISTDELSQALTELKYDLDHLTPTKDSNTSLMEFDQFINNITKGLDNVSTKDFNKLSQSVNEALTTGFTVPDFEEIKANILRNIALIQNELDKRNNNRKGKKNKENKEDLKAEENYLTALQKLVEDYIQTGIEMETNEFERQLRTENENHRKLIDELQGYLGKTEALTRQANKNIELEQERHFKEIIRIALDAANQQNIESNKLSEDEADRKRKADEYLAQRKIEYDKKLAENRDKERKKETDQILKELAKITHELIIELDKKSEREQEAFDRSISKREDNIKRQEELAALGLDNELAFQKAKLDKEELQRKDALERAQKQKEAAQLVEAYFNAFNAELQQPGSSPQGAAGKALADVLLAKGVAKGLVQFALEGNEDVQAAPGQKAEKGKDSIPFMLAPGEAVIKESSNKKYKGVAKALNSGEFEKIYQPRFKESSSFADNVANSVLLAKVSKTNELLEDLVAKPIQNWKVNQLGELVETWYQKGKQTNITHKRPRLNQ